MLRETATVGPGLIGALLTENHRLRLQLARLEDELGRLREENGMLPEVLLECERQLAGRDAARPC